MADKERTPLLRGDGGASIRRKRQIHNAEHTRTGPTRRQRSLGETFTLDDDHRTLHKISQDGSDHGELQRNYSRFLLFGGNSDSRKSSSGVSSSGASAAGGGATNKPRSHRRQWSSATEPHRNLTANSRGLTNKPLTDSTQPEESMKDGDKQAAVTMTEGKRRNSNKTIILFERDYYSTVKHMAVLISYIILMAYTLLVLFGPLFLLPVERAKWCPESESTGNSGGADDDDDSIYDEPHYENPDYITDPCFHKRLPELLGLTLEECDLSRRMLASVMFGGVIGFERRVADRPAGIRTMGLVSLGSCFFTISSQLAFKSSTMGWDASRVTAAIPTGVGFLGAGLIWKGTVGIGEEEVHQVHGLSTAASLWLSAAVGAGAGGALYFVAGYSVILVILILRYGPQLYLQDDLSYNEDDDENDEEYEQEEQETKPRQQSIGMESIGRSTGKADEFSLGGDESCPSFVSLTDLQQAQATEDDSLRVTTPPPQIYGSTQTTAAEGDSERHSILRTPGAAGGSPNRGSGERKVQITFGDVSPPPLSMAGRETSEARSVASRSSSIHKRLSTKGGKAQKKKKRPISKRPTFHS